MPTLPFLSQGAITTMTSPLATASTLPPATFVPQNYVSLPAPVVNSGGNTQPAFVGLGTPLSYVPPSVDAKSLSLSGVVTAPDVSLPQPSTGQTSGTAQPVTASVTPRLLFGSLRLSVLILGPPLIERIVSILKEYVSVIPGPRKQSVPAIC